MWKPTAKPAGIVLSDPALTAKSTVWMLSNAGVTLAGELGSSVEELVEQIKGQHEVNPMLGLSGCRLGIAKPAVFEMQTRAVIKAAFG